MTNLNEWTNTLLHKNITLTLYFWRGWSWLCVRIELETGTDCNILTQSSSDHSSTSFAFWLSCSTAGHWGCKPSVWSWLSLCWHPIYNCNSPKPSVARGYIIVSCPPVSCGRMHISPSPNSTTSTVQGDIPIYLTGCTCFAVLPLIYTSHLLIDGSVEGQYVTLSMGQIELNCVVNRIVWSRTLLIFKLHNYARLNYVCKYADLLHGTVWNETVYMYKKGFGIK